MTLVVVVEWSSRMIQLPLFFDECSVLDCLFYSLLPLLLPAALCLSPRPHTYHYLALLQLYFHCFHPSVVVVVVDDGGVVSGVVHPHHHHHLVDVDIVAAAAVEDAVVVVSDHVSFHLLPPRFRPQWSIFFDDRNYRLSGNRFCRRRLRRHRS